MIKCIVYSVLCTILMGCDFEVTQPKELDHYIEEFSRLTSRNVRDIDISFGKLGKLPGVPIGASKDAAASCYLMLDRPRIVIDPNKWKLLPEPGKIMALWHELYHCEYNQKDHIQGALNCDGYNYPHLMNATVSTLDMTEAALDCQRGWLGKH